MLHAEAGRKIGTAVGPGLVPAREDRVDCSWSSQGPSVDFTDWASPIGTACGTHREPGHGMLVSCSERHDEILAAFACHQIVHACRRPNFMEGKEGEAEDDETCCRARQVCDLHRSPTCEAQECCENRSSWRVVDDHNLGINRFLVVDGSFGYRPDY